MKYSLTIKAKLDDNLYNSLLPDISKTERAEWNIKKKKDCLEIQFDAKDIIALKAFVSSITKLLEVNEKLDGVKDEC